MPVNRLVFLDESGMSITMSRTHAWVKRGQEYIDRVPMNRGKNLTLLVDPLRRLGHLEFDLRTANANASSHG